jgi:hypothetical protein
MALAWFICGYKLRRPGFRYPAMDDFTAQINADGGTWSNSEVLGGYTVIKVRANAATLTTIGGTAGYTRIPNHFALTDILGDLTSGQRNTLLTLLGNMGYTPAEISAALGSNLAGWRTKTLGQALRFMAQRRLQSRWDADAQQFVLDGIFLGCKPIDEVDAEVQ